MKLLFTLLLLCFSIRSFSQRMNEDSLIQKPQNGSADWHLMKWKNQRTGGFVLLSAGTIVSIVSFMSILNGPWITFSDEERKKEDAKVTRFFVGTGIMASSIPLFISARSHKKKADLLLKNEKVFLPDPAMRNQFVAVGVRFSL